MTIPLDRLYNFLDDSVDHDMVIYRWHPHGSRKIEHCTLLRDYEALAPFFTQINPIVICHDQEPLNYGDMTWRLDQWLQHKNMKPSSQYWHLVHLTGINVHSKYVLLHSEINSDQVDLFRAQGAEPAFYWSHALIARDWFRYARLDPALDHKHSWTKDFLIYNRAWSGTREYRLKFAEMMVDRGLQHRCETAFRAHDPHHYNQHTFANDRLQITRSDLERLLPPNNHPATSSADYVNRDYANCWLEVVLETLFDTNTVHLTEKVLRPIACGKPFLLAAGPGALRFLRGYGFRTWQGVINEDYDLEPDPVKRLGMILDEMQRLSTCAYRTQISHELYAIAQFNKRRFFSRNFFRQVVDEYQQNIGSALARVRDHADGRYINDRWSVITPTPLVQTQYQACMAWLASQVK